MEFFLPIPPWYPAFHSLQITRARCHSHADVQAILRLEDQKCLRQSWWAGWWQLFQARCQYEGDQAYLHCNYLCCQDHLKNSDQTSAPSNSLQQFSKGW